MAKVKPNFKPTHRHFLREWREFRGLKQDAAADRIGIDRSYLSRIENHHNPYTQNIVEAAAIAYNCEPIDLLIRNPLRPNDPWSIYDSLRTADPARLGQIRAVVDALLTKAS